MNAKNFQEYLASTGRANSGLSAQARMQYGNNLNTSMNTLNAGEAAALADINRRTSLANDSYNTGLAGANAQIEANYIQNLLNERNKELERQMQEKQYKESVRQFNEQMKFNREQLQSRFSSGSGGGGYTSYGGYSSNGNSSKNQVNTDWYSGKLNSDAKYGTFSTKDKNGISYQPNNIGKDSKGNVKYLKSSGKTVGQMYGKGKLVGSTGANLDNQTVWQYGKNYYIWDGSQNQYIKIK